MFFDPSLKTSSISETSILDPKAFLPLIADVIMEYLLGCLQLILEREEALGVRFQRQDALALRLCNYTNAYKIEH